MHGTLADAGSPRQDGCARTGPDGRLPVKVQVVGMGLEERGVLRVAGQWHPRQ
ncbi:MAG: hypothetical protein ACRDRH_27530 [Pseudonocardia sp.]